MGAGPQKDQTIISKLGFSAPILIPQRGKRGWNQKLIIDHAYVRKLP